MDFNIALDKNNYYVKDDGATIHSHIIYIPPGHVALLSLFNMLNIATLEDGDLVNKSCLTVKKLAFSRTGNLDIELVCGKDINLAKEAEKLLKNRCVYSEPVYQNCCAWSISPSSNFALIPTPGFYILETSDVEQIDTMYVEYAILTAEQAIAIPNAFKLGG